MDIYAHTYIYERFCLCSTYNTHIKLAHTYTLVIYNRKFHVEKPCFDICMYTHMLTYTYTHVIYNRIFNVEKSCVEICMYTHMLTYTYTHGIYNMIINVEKPCIEICIYTYTNIRICVCIYIIQNRIPKNTYMSYIYIYVHKFTTGF